jgi:hypothetical protein
VASVREKNFEPTVGAQINTSCSKDRLWGTGYKLGIGVWEVDHGDDLAGS